MQYPYILTSKSGLGPSATKVILKQVKWGCLLKPSPLGSFSAGNLYSETQAEARTAAVHGQRESQLGFLCGLLCPALAAGPDDPLMFIIICRERRQLDLYSLGPSGPALGDPQVGSWGLGAFQHQLLAQVFSSEWLEPIFV